MTEPSYQEQAYEAAHARYRERISGEKGPVDSVRDIIEAAEPFIRADEREKLREALLERIDYVELALSGVGHVEALLAQLDEEHPMSEWSDRQKLHAAGLPQPDQNIERWGTTKLGMAKSPSGAYVDFDQHRAVLQAVEEELKQENEVTRHSLQRSKHRAQRRNFEQKARAEAAERDLKELRERFENLNRNYIEVQEALANHEQREEKG